jgi:hypothetical protein
MLTEKSKPYFAFLPLQPGRLISLFEMNEFAADKMVNITANIEHLEKLAFFHPNPPKVSISWNIDKQQVKNCLSSILPDLEFLELHSTRAGCQRVIDGIDSLKAENLGQTCVELRHRLNDEMKGRTFFQLRKNQIGIFNNTLIAGDQFKANFPKANTELIEAGNCLALDRYTACVCHLMRALEYVLKALQNELDITPDPEPWKNTWGKILAGIEAKKGDGKKIKPSSEWMKQRDFYDKCYSFLNATKTPYRDSTFHVVSIYDEASAKSIFAVTVEMLRHSATKLSEKP